MDKEDKRYIELGMLGCNINDESLVESKEDILSVVEKEIGVSDRPIDGPSYILPNGKFLTIWRSKIPVSKYSATGSATHRDVQDFLYNKGLVKDRGIDVDDPELEKLGCIRVNSGFEEYIWLPDDRPNETQWQSLLVWLDWYFRFHSKLMVGYYHYAPKTYYSKDYTTDEILKKCKEAYARGYLTEGVDSVLRFPQKEVDDLIKSLESTYKGIALKKLSVDKLVKDNDLLNDDDLESYHERIWNNKKAKDFHIDLDKINSTRMSGIPFATQKKDGRVLLSDGRHRTRAAYNDGYKFIEIPVYVEESLNESKQDIEKFRQWVGDEKLFNKFFELKDRLKNREKDIYYWMGLEKELLKNQSLYHTSDAKDSDFAHKKAVDALEFALEVVEQEPSKNKVKKHGKEGAKKIYEDENWQVYDIQTYEASVLYGKHTSWCVTGNNSDQGKKDYDTHTDCANLIFYIPKKGSKSYRHGKYALEFESMNSWLLYNDADFVEVGVGSLWDSRGGINQDCWQPVDTGGIHPDFPKINGLPDINKRYEEVANELGWNKPIILEEFKDNVLDALDKEFGQEELYMWSTYILPNGHFLNPDNSNWWDEVGYDPQYEHCDFEGWAYDKGYNLSDIYNNCIKMNVTYPYLSMPDKAKPTQEQLNAIRKILDRKDLFEPEGTFYWYDIFPEEKVNNKGANLLGIYTPVGDELFDLDVSDSYDIIRAINQAYIRGGFFNESLKESVIPLKDCPTNIIIGTIDFTQYVKNKINNIDLRVFYDTNKDWYLVAPAYNSIHDDIIEDAIKAGYYDAKNYDAEFTGYDLTKLSDFASYIHKQGKPFVICTDIENPEDIYPYQYKLNVEGTIVYVLSYYDLRELDFINNNLIEVLKEDLNEKIVKKGSKWQVQSEKGRNLGTYNTKAEAEKRLQQVHYFKHMNESSGFPITVYTYQSPEVRKQLEEGKTYIASYERANYNHYQDLAKLLGLSNCPIFGALTKNDLYSMLNSSGIDWEEENILHLEIPKENLHYMEYYDWTDYMYALDDPESFEEETGLSLQGLEDLIKTQKSSIDYDECQVVFDRIEPQWYEDGKNEPEEYESLQEKLNWNYKNISKDIISNLEDLTYWNDKSFGVDVYEDDWEDGCDIEATYSDENDTELAWLVVRVYQDRQAITFRQIDVYENGGLRGTGFAKALVERVLRALPKGTKILVHMDMSGGFWYHMSQTFKDFDWDKSLHEDLDNDYDRILETELNVLNNWLDKYGFEIELINDYEFDDNSVGMFLNTQQDNASVFPIALNRRYIEDYCKDDKEELVYAIRGTLWHEAGHGIYDFLFDVLEMPEDVEECVEEFARYPEDCELYDLLQEYMKQDESLKESLQEDVERYCDLKEASYGMNKEKVDFNNMIRTLFKQSILEKLLNSDIIYCDENNLDKLLTSVQSPKVFFTFVANKGGSNLNNVSGLIQHHIIYGENPKTFDMSIQDHTSLHNKVNFKIIDELKNDLWEIYNELYYQPYMNYKSSETYSEDIYKFALFENCLRAMGQKLKDLGINANDYKEKINTKITQYYQEDL